MFGNFLGTHWEDNFTEMGTFWELVMEYQLNHKFGKYFSVSQKLGNIWKSSRFFFPILGNLLQNFREDNFTEMGTFWELVMEYQLSHKFGKYFFLFPKSWEISGTAADFPPILGNLL